MFVICYCQNQIYFCLILERGKVGVRERKREKGSNRMFKKDSKRPE